MLADSPNTIVVPPDQAARQAGAAIQGYAYQLYQTVSAWLSLRPNELLHELCLNLGDGVNQAANLASSTTSIPSRNLAPLTTFGNWF